MINPINLFSNLTSNVTQEPVTQEPLAIPPLGFIVTVTCLSMLAIVSQAIVIIISMGLEGNFSAQTIMVVQSFFEILKMMMNLQRAMCGLSGYCKV